MIENRSNWVGAAARGLVVCLLVSCMLSVAARLFLPEVVEDSAESNWVGLCVWSISLAAGGWQFEKTRRTGAS